MVKFLAYQINALVRLLPNALTNPFPPSMMGSKYLKVAKSNPFGVPANRTSQAICAKHCGNCPSNPFTHGGLYCISGKSKKHVSTDGCNCFDCELFEQCGGGQGYFCKYGTAAETNKLGADKMAPRSDGEGAFADNAYDQSFISELIDDDAHPVVKSTDKKTPQPSKKPAIAKDGAKDGVKRSDTEKVSVVYEGENGEDLTITADTNLSILENSLANGINHTHACGGRAKCSTCRVLVIENQMAFAPRNDEEQRISRRKLFTPSIRLGCQIKPKQDCTIRRLVMDEQQTEEAIGEGTLFASPISSDREATVLFCDIRSFTTYSEKSLPYDIVHMLNEYFETICAPIDKYGGYVDKYMGDGIMAIFGIKKEGKNHEKNALKAAFAMLEALKRFNMQQAKKNAVQLDIGIGLHSGELVLATIGFKKKRQFTAIGDVVNTSSRIESATKKAKTPLLVSENVYKVLKDEVFWGRSVKEKLKGKSELLKLYEPLGFRTTPRKITRGG